MNIGYKTHHMKRVVKTIVNICALVLKLYGWVELGGGKRGCKTCWDIQDFIEQVTIHRGTQIFKIR